ncbi:MAG: hypothetical protein BM563_03355 [Bacteroidetes bacterium MedPE-SWsnd-G1]|nr:MAG: hypothetical protein BM563_03355 [Bacteroidetes bacterium MedPE-SWsnd-G1]
MVKKITTSTLISYAIPLIIALVIILDFSLPGKVYAEDAVTIEKELQRYYNAGGNYHYSYEVVTPERRFAVSETFANEVRGKSISYSVSLIFNQVNKHGLANSSKTNIYSFRIASGLVYPLFVIFILFIHYKYNKNWTTLLFVLQVILLADLFLVMN